MKIMAQEKNGHGGKQNQEDKSDQKQKKAKIDAGSRRCDNRRGICRGRHAVDSGGGPGFFDRHDQICFRQNGILDPGTRYGPAGTALSFCLVRAAAGSGKGQRAELYEKKNNKKVLAICRWFLYNTKCCDMIAMKREVAALMWQVFPWSECQVRKLATSHCTKRIIYKVKR